MFLIFYWIRVTINDCWPKNKKTFVPICNSWVTSKFLFSYDGEAEDESQSNIIIRVNHTRRINSKQNCEQPYWLQIAGGRISVIHKAWYFREKESLSYPLPSFELLFSRWASHHWSHVSHLFEDLMMQQIVYHLEEEEEVFENPHLNI